MSYSIRTNDRSDDSILNYYNQAKLVPTKKGSKRSPKFVCPECGQPKLSIDTVTGKFTCYGPCEGMEEQNRPAIFKAVKKLAGQWQDGNGNKGNGKGKKVWGAKKSKPIVSTPLYDGDLIPFPIVSNGKVEIFKNDQGQDQYRLKPESGLPKGMPPSDWQNFQYHFWFEFGEGRGEAKFTRPDSDPNSYKDEKTHRPYYLDSSGKTWKSGKGTGDWPAYNERLLLSLIKENPKSNCVYLVEGPGNAEFMRSVGLLAVAIQGANADEKTMASLLKILKDHDLILVITEDNDTSGSNHAKASELACDKFGVESVIVPWVLIEPSIPIGGDVKECLNILGKEKFLDRLKEVTESCQIDKVRKQLDDDSDAEAWDQAYYIRAYNKVFDGGLGWYKQGMKGPFYQYQDGVYEMVSEANMMELITEYNQEIEVDDGNGNLSYPCANPEKNKSLLTYAIQNIPNLPKKIKRPDGFCCNNGNVIVTVIKPKANEKPIVTWELVKHDPKYFFTSKGNFDFNPAADTSQYDELKKCLTPNWYDLFIKNTAGLIGLDTVRIHKGRAVKCLQLIGGGSNGKDTLRNVVTRFLGNSNVTNVSISGFNAYDEGRFFPLSCLENSLLNWASENLSRGFVLEKSKSLVSVITGDPITIERKGKDATFAAKLSTIVYLNCNETIRMYGTSDYAIDRFGAIPFPFRYTTRKVLRKGELRANPKFKEDDDFIDREILPAFANDILKGYKALIEDGIDWSESDDLLGKMAQENNHFLRFLDSLDYEIDPDSTFYLSDLMSEYRPWLQDNDLATIDQKNNKPVWTYHDSIKKGHDKAPTTLHDLGEKLKEFFPGRVEFFKRTPQGHLWSGIKFKGIDKGKDKLDAVRCSQMLSECSEIVNIPSFDAHAEKTCQKKENFSIVNDQNPDQQLGENLGVNCDNSIKPLPDNDSHYILTTLSLHSDIDSNEKSILSENQIAEKMIDSNTELEVIGKFGQKITENNDDGLITFLCYYVKSGKYVSGLKGQDNGLKYLEDVKIRKVGGGRVLKQDVIVGEPIAKASPNGPLVYFPITVWDKTIYNDFGDGHDEFTTFEVTPDYLPHFGLGDNVKIESVTLSDPYGSKVVKPGNYRITYKTMGILQGLLTESVDQSGKEYHAKLVIDQDDVSVYSLPNSLVNVTIKAKEVGAKKSDDSFIFSLKLPVKKVDFADDSLIIKP